jgi:spore coat polysaccharide biosynthesis protein SpsF (cytidylyltransferase family)
MKVVAVIQARIKSNRFPEKITKQINDKTLLQLVIANAISLKAFDEIIVATSEDENSSFVHSTCIEMNVSFFQGSINDLSARYIDATKHLNNEDTVARITADNPIVFKELCYFLLNSHLNNENDYTCAESLTHCGLELIKVSALRELKLLELSDYEKEHVTPFFRNENCKFKTQQISYSVLRLDKHFDDLLTIDFPKDLVLIQQLSEIVNIYDANKEEIYSALEQLTS